MKKILSMLLIVFGFSNLIMGAYTPDIRYLSPGYSGSDIKLWDLSKTDIPSTPETISDKAKLPKLEDPEYLKQQLEKAKKAKEEGRIIETISPDNKYMATAEFLSNEFKIKSLDPKLKFNIIEKVGFSISEILWKGSSLTIVGFDVNDENAIRQRFKIYSSEDLDLEGKLQLQKLLDIL